MYSRQWGGLQNWRHGSKMNLMCSQIGEESILIINPYCEELECEAENFKFHVRKGAV